MHNHTDSQLMKAKTPLAVFVALALAGCAGQPTDISRDLPFLFNGSPRPQLATEAALEGKPDAFPEPVLFRGDDQVVNLPKKDKPFEVMGEAVALGFEQAPLTDVVHAILGDLLRVDYSIDQPLKGEITLHTRTTVERSELFSILESVLQANGALVVLGNDGLYHVGPADAVKGLSPQPRRFGSKVAGFGMVVIPLQHIGAAEMADILRPVAPPDAFVRVDTVRNILILAGSRNQLEGWGEIINTFDVDMLKGMSVGIFPLEHSSVKDMSLALNTLLGSGSTGGAGAVAKTATTGMVKILPVERLNSILVVTPRAHYLDQVREWLTRLDRAPENSFEPQLYVYPIQNGNAQHLAKLLNGLFGGGKGASTSTSSDSGVAPGLSQTTLSSGGGLGGTSAGGSSSGDASAAAMKEMGSIGSQSGSSGGGTTQISLGEQIRVVADDESNALLIYAPRRDYLKIEKALRQLDLAPSQVLIEVSILEVTLNDELKYGLSWVFDNVSFGSKPAIASLNLNASGGIAPAQPGFSYAISSAGSLRAVLNALASKSLVKVISSPSVLVLDNQTAAIHVGDQQPIRSGETLTTGGNITTSIQYKDTGVMLAVTPSVNAGGMVSMNIKQTVTDVGNVDTATGQRSFMQRNIATRVAVRSGDSIALGGLIKENQTKGKQGIPGLHNLPLIGGLFGSTNNVGIRTELLVMITPRVLENDEDLREISAEYRERMQSLKTLQRPKDNDAESAVPVAE